jgi:hypothetical protein
MGNASWEVVRSTNQYVLLRDVGPWDKYMTITNAAEQVVAALTKWLGSRRLLYYDSEGELTELLVKDGHFTGFAPGKLEE